jgi:hypothetical protein
LEAGVGGGELTAVGESVASATSRPKAMATARSGALGASAVAMAVAPGRRDECREMVDQLQWGERRGAVTLWFGQAVDDMVGVKQFQTLQREGWAGTIAQLDRGSTRLAFSAPPAATPRAALGSVLARRRSCRAQARLLFK